MPTRRSKPNNNRRWGAGNRVIIPRKKTSPLNAMAEIPYKDVELLRQYLTERGRILPRRISGNNAHAQRKLATAVKRARRLALLSPGRGYVPQFEPVFRPERPPRMSRDRDRDRGDRGDRYPRGDRDQRGDREPHGDRYPRGDRDQRGDRYPRGDRDQHGERHSTSNPAARAVPAGGSPSASSGTASSSSAVSSGAQSPSS